MLFFLGLFHNTVGVKGAHVFDNIVRLNKASFSCFDIKCWDWLSYWRGFRRSVIRLLSTFPTRDPFALSRVKQQHLRHVDEFFLVLNESENKKQQLWCTVSTQWYHPSPNVATVYCFGRYFINFFCYTDT